MEDQTIHVITIANSIIGVSILAMPYCFKQCGIVLSILILVVSSIISRLSCHLLLKSAIMARRRTFEFLAFHAFGPLGKFIIEVGLIGFLLGTCIAFFVVMGDLAPAIVAKMTGTRATDTLRTSILIALALFCVLPLGLLRNIDSLSSVCMATIGFYFCLVLKIVAESALQIFSSSWLDKVELWRPAGILQCLPIFSMALFCQTQIFEIYQAIPNASLERMNNLIRMAVNICTGVYIFVGIFGYIAFCGQSFSGNILMSFSTSLMSEIMKIGFVLSVAFSFPLIIFPCRASLYSLLYKQTYSSIHEGMDKYIPEGRFKGLTFLIVLVSLVIGVMIPNIELVLGLVGSTIGIMICVLFPAMCFICISTKNTNERILAQLMLFIGIIVMVLGTYANLYAMEEIGMNPPVSITEKVVIKEPEILKLVQEDPSLKVIDIPNTTKAPMERKQPDKPKEFLQPDVEAIKEVRHEPPQPEEPADIPAVPEVKSSKEAEVEKSNDQQINEAVKVGRDKLKDLNLEKPVEQAEVKGEDKKIEESPVLQQPPNPEAKDSDQPHQDDNKELKAVEQPVKEAKLPENNNIETRVKEAPAEPLPKNINVQPPPVEAADIGKVDNNEKKNQEVDNNKSSDKKGEEVDIEAIKKEEKELLEQEKEKLKEEEKKSMDLIKSLEKRNEEQKKLVEDSKKLLEEIKQRQEALKQDKQQKKIDKVNEETMKAVEQIKQIAEKAIEKLSGADKSNGLPQDAESNKSNQTAEGVPIKQNQNVENNPKANDAKLKDPVEIKEPNVPNSNQEKLFNADEKPVELNLNNDKLNSQNANEKPKEAGSGFKNLPPLPIAINSNYSELYKSMVVKSDTPKVVNDDPSLPKESDKNVIPEKVEAVDTNKHIKKQEEVTEEKPKVDNKVQQMNLLDVLRTNAEKVTVLNQDKQAVQHREIRSADNVKLQDNENIPYDENKVLRVAISNVVEGKDIEDSCDKDEKNSNDKKESGSTQTPLIRMITRLSEPELVSLKLPDVNNLDVVLKPLKRDLKSYKSRKK